MTRLLILAYDFPPYVSVGALRPYAWYKYLKEYGIYPIVITRQWSNTYGDERDYIAPGESRETIIEETEYGTIIRTPYKPNMANRLMLKYGKSRYALLRKAISAYYEFVQYIWNVGPKSCIYREAKHYLKRYDVNAIIATGDPFILFKYASVLSKQFKIPWIADYRDMWSQDIHSINKTIVTACNAYYEHKYVSSAKQIITVSELLKFKISTLVKGVPFAIIPNGYNEEYAYQSSEIEQDKNLFSIAFAGTLYEWHPIKSALSAIAQWREEKNIDLSIDFYGINNHTGEEIPLLLHGLEDVIHIYPKCSNDILMRNLASHHAMLLFNDYSIIGTKIYDYIAVKRKILLCYTNDIDAQKLKEQYFLVSDIEGRNDHLQADLIKETNSGIIVQNKQHLMHVLNDLYQEFSSNGYIACESVNVEKYSRKEQTKILANIIKNI